MQQQIIILPCNGDSAAGFVTWIAAQELVLEGKARWYSAANPPADSELFILLDGCDRQCLFNRFLDNGLIGKHNLALPDVGIEPIYLEDITRDDIELAKDAVIAECTSVDDLRPPLFPGCCC